MEAEARCAAPLRVFEALRLLGTALQSSSAPSTVWFKESSQKNLRSRDFLVPRGTLKNSFPDGEVPADVIEKLRSLAAPGLPPIKNCLQSEAGLLVQLDRPAVFRQVLKDFTPYLRPPSSADSGPDVVILNCAPLHSNKALEALRLSHLRAVLIADHLAEVLTLQGKHVYRVPAAFCTEVEGFLSQLGISWPSSADAPALEETVSCFKDLLRDCDEDTGDVDSAQSPGAIRVQLKTSAEKHNICLQGYDPNLDFFLVNEDDLRHIARLQRSVQAATSPCTVLHIVSCEEEFHQQKLDLLWRLVLPSTGDVAQKHLVCGRVKVVNSASAVTCSQYFQMRKSQMLEASVMKYGDSVQGESWDEIINSLTSAAIKFELLATPHRSQVNLNLEETNITTKGTKSGAFVMYNCARLATMFDSYNSAVSQGIYPEFPPARELSYSSLCEEGEWLLLFNYIMMLPEVLSQSGQMSSTSPGIRVTANTEVICKFLVSLSMDFSCYYNRVHILGEPLPHLFSRMFARLQLMKGVQSVLHSALKTLHIMPLTQI
ncbi:DALR anticodon-binding domain-containing protein 3 isoform X2 [Eleutherodactylus coqui]|uniref:DALR anticodon-binding domain-containing protein 3 isoform X2 n=1 Tax=Eleutherodactylus coqui TaxID=57060 RepID=UPI0034622E18